LQNGGNWAIADDEPQMTGERHMDKQKSRPARLSRRTRIDAFDDAAFGCSSCALPLESACARANHPPLWVHGVVWYMCSTQSDLNRAATTTLPKSYAWIISRPRFYWLDVAVKYPPRSSELACSELLTATRPRAARLGLFNFRTLDIYIEVFRRASIPPAELLATLCAVPARHRLPHRTTKLHAGLQSNSKA
jgi:hypothetical protein